MVSLTCWAVTAISQSARRQWPLYLGATLVALLAWSAISAHGGTPDPTDPGHLSHGAIILDSGLLVFREGLETILVLAAVTAGVVDTEARSTASRSRSVPPPDSSLSVATWFLTAWVLGQLGGGGLAVQAATGLLAIIVLLVVMNWFFHKSIGPAGSPITAANANACSARPDGSTGHMIGLLALGLSSVYREGFESSSSCKPAAHLGGTEFSRASRSACADRGGRRPHLLGPPQLRYKRMLVLTASCSASS